MMSIPQLAAALQQVLTTVACQAARTTDFIQRERAFNGAQFVQTLVFGWLEDPRASVEDLATLAADLGVSISGPGLTMRFTEPAVACLEQVLQAAVAQMIAADPLAIPLLERFPEVLLHDTTTISLPDCLAAWFQGSGGSQGQVAAALKAHLRWELRTGQLEGPICVDGRSSDRALGFARRPAAGALVLRDLGFFQLEDLAFDQRDGRHWLTRLKPNTAIFVAKQRVNLLDYLSDAPAGVVEVAVEVGVAQRIPARLIAQPVPEAVVAQRQERLRKEARDKGYQLRAERLALARWTILITTLDAEQLSPAEAEVLLRLRWQIELLFKLWKSDGGLDESRGKRPARVLCELYAKWIGLLIQHWLLLSGCWEVADRSLPKAAKVVRKASRTLAKTLARPRRLQTALRELVSQLARAGRQTKRTKKPNAYLLLQDPVLRC